MSKMTPRNQSTGYLRLQLFLDGRRETKYVHQLVLLTFAGPRPADMLACHGPDPDKHNCSIANLRWDTRAANTADNSTQGIKPDTRRGKLNPDRVRELRRLSGEGVSNGKLARRYSISLDMVRKVVRRECWGGVE